MRHFIFVFLLLPLLSLAQDTVSVVTYNLLDYANANRDAHFETVMTALDADLIVVQEIHNQSDVNNFLDDVLNATGTEYAAGTFIENDPINKAIFYKSSVFTFVSNTAIPTVLRDINEFQMIHNASGDLLYLYGLHLTAGSGSTIEQQRLQEINTLRSVTDALPIGTDFIVLGDLNMQESTEDGYQALLAQGNSGYVIDPINRPGDWNNNSQFADVHTQSTRTRAFGGGATGGMDDRFDQILISQSISDAGGIEYVAGSYDAYGNDGFHFNDSINAPPNNAVPADIADALHDASDHLPVIFEISFEDVSVPDVGCEVVVNPTSGETGIFSYAMTFTNNTTSPQQVQLWAEVFGPNDYYDLVFTKNKNFGPMASATKNRNYLITGGQNAPPGDYQFVLYTGTFPNDIMDSSTDTYTQLGDEGEVVINEINYNPLESGTDTTEFIELFNTGGTPIALDGYYFDQGVTFTFPGGATLAANDYMVITTNSQGFLNYYGFAADYEWSSDALSNSGEDIVLKSFDGSTIDSVDYDDGGGWPTGPDGNGPTLELIDPASDNNDPANWAASTGSADPGGSPGSLNSVSIAAKAFPSASSVGAVPSDYQLLQNYPNPFNPNTLIGIQLPVKSTISLKIHDASGRIVNELARGPVDAGTYAFTWNGRNHSGDQVASGVYFYVLATQDGFSAAKKMILLR